MWIAILLVVAGLVAGVGVAASRKPDRYAYSRSIVIDAAPAAVFQHVNDLRAWGAWSPWIRLDPAAKMTFSGPAAGTGASTAWDGNSKVGAGSMTISDSVTPSRINIHLVFVRPMKGVSDVTFNFDPEQQGTRVTWSMAGENTFPGKVLSLFIDCEKMIGDQYEKGLANLKAVVESQP